MVDLISEILPKLRDRRLPGLDLPEPVVYPSYDGYSLINLPATLCRLLEVPDFGGTPLAPEILSALGNGIQRILLLVIDGLGLEHFQRYLESNSPPVWKQLQDRAVFAPLTSVVPSTTAAALTSIWTGAAPAAHGVVGYEVWLKEYGLVANMINHSAMSYAGDPGGLLRTGFTPETFLPVPTLGPHLAQQRVKTRAFMHHSIARSGLSAMHLPEVRVSGYRNTADLWISLRGYLEGKSRQRLFMYAYWSDLDELAHRFGPNDQRLDVEFASFSRVFADELLAPLSRRNREDTLVILTADHGLIHTPKTPKYELRHHFPFVRMLPILPSGENRLPYLFIRPGQVEEVCAYLARTWPDTFSVLTAQQAVESGLFGPAPHAAVLADRLGDLVLIPKGDAFLWWADRESTMLGRHGGLSPQEMLVAFFAFRV